MGKLNGITQRLSTSNNRNSFIFREEVGIIKESKFRLIKSEYS